MLLADFPVVILDEPAEHLDEKAADALTSDLITHRPVVSTEVDQVLRLTDGRLEPVRSATMPGPLYPKFHYIS